MRNAVIVSTARSPIGRAGKGSLRETRGDDLAAAMVTAALSKVPQVESQTVDELYVGAWDHTGEQAENMARRVAVLANLDDVPAVSVNRACASSVQTTRMATHAIWAGDGDVFVSAGVEAVSRYPVSESGSSIGQGANSRFDAARRRTERIAAGQEGWSDPRVQGELPDIYISMGLTAENVANSCGVSRADQDTFALRSQQLASEAISQGFFEREITPVTNAAGELITRDDSPRPGTTLEGLEGLPPVFAVNGTVTAGNCCPLNDGAAAVIIMEEERARELGIEPLARILSFGVSALSPEIMGLGPVEAVGRALAKVQMSTGDVDLYEINEAFAAQVIASCRQLDLDMDRVNVHGGAIALGHPFGMTGARITTTLINGLQTRDKEIGVETMCVGGGQGMAMVIQRLR